MRVFLHSIKPIRENIAVGQMNLIVWLASKAEKNEDCDNQKQDAKEVSTRGVDDLSKWK